MDQPVYRESKEIREINVDKPVNDLKRRILL